MGTVNFTVSKYGRLGLHSGSGPVISTTVRTSDAFSSTTAADYIEDGSGDITLSVGEIFRVHIDEAAWVRFNAVATVGDGFYIPANQTMEFECDVAGKVSVIDVA